MSTSTGTKVVVTPAMRRKALAGAAVSFAAWRKKPHARVEATSEARSLMSERSEDIPLHLSDRDKRDPRVRSRVRVRARSEKRVLTTTRMLTGAKELWRLYQTTLSGRQEWRIRERRKWADLSDTEKNLLFKAVACMEELKLTPQQFINAQFWWYSRLNRKKGRLMLPQLHQLHGDGAVTKAAEYLESLAEDKARKPVAKADEIAHTDFEREGRKLTQLTKVLGTTRRDVLLLLPNEFTRVFLERRGVWSEVSKRWIAARD